MKRIIKCFALPFVLVTLNASAQTKNKIKDYEFLIGEFEVQVYLPKGNGEWVAGGNGSASFYPILDNTFIREDIATTMGNTTFTMNNTFGTDGRSGQSRLIALDKEYSTMDVYHGKVEKENTLVYDNLNSDIPAKTSDGKEISFRITYSKLNENENQVFAEITLDKGETWRPYAKNKFIRKEATSQN